MDPAAGFGRPPASLAGPPEPDHAGYSRTTRALIRLVVRPTAGPDDGTPSDLEDGP
jgi:hypothetical protein